MKINDLYKCNVLPFVNDKLIGKCPKIFEKYYQLKQRNYNFRQKGKLEMPPARIELGDRAVRINGAKLWNEIDKSIHQYRFTTSLKKYS